MGLAMRLSRLQQGWAENCIQQPAALAFLAAYWENR
jgi:hypothetical protein